jgi:hypothetical protein
LFVQNLTNLFFVGLVLKFDEEGGGGTIGREICIHCAEEGAFVFLCDLDKVKGNFIIILNPSITIVN